MLDGAAHERTGIRQDLLLVRGQGVRGAAGDVLEIEPVDREPRLGGDEGVECLFPGAEDLRLDKGGRGR